MRLDVRISRQVQSTGPVICVIKYKQPTRFPSLLFFFFFLLILWVWLESAESRNDPVESALADFWNH